MSLISERYAAALFAIGEDKKKIDVLSEDLSFLSEIWNSQPDLKGYLRNPRKSPKEKEMALTNIFASQVDAYAFQLLLLLLRKDRLDLLPEICSDFQRMREDSQDILHITITTAKEAEPDTIRKISDRFQKKYSAGGVRVTTKVDPSLIGGVQVQVGDTLYDDSVKGKLKALQEELVSH